MKDATTTAEVRPHGLTLENRARAVLTGVSDVDLFSEQTIVAATSGGTITVTGQGLHVESLNLEDGRRVATGKVDSIVYDERQPKKGALRRILR